MIKKCILFICSLLILFTINAQDISLVFFIDEHSEAGTLLGTISATDPDGNQVSFSIVSGNEEGAFMLDAESGDLTVNDPVALDFEVTPMFALVVEADDGVGGMTTGNIIIHLNDIDENPLSVIDGSLVKIYPNPFDNWIVVEMLQTDLKTPVVTLYSLDGKRVSVNQTYISDGNIRIGFLNQPIGLYLLEIKVDNRIIVRRKIHTH